MTATGAQVTPPSFDASSVIWSIRVRSARYCVPATSKKHFVPAAVAGKVGLVRIADVPALQFQKSNFTALLPTPKALTGARNGRLVPPTDQPAAEMPPQPPSKSRGNAATAAAIGTARTELLPVAEPPQVTEQ